MFEWSEEDEQAGRRSTIRSRGRPESEAMLDKDPGSGAARLRTTSSATGSSSAAARSESTSPSFRQRIFDFLGISPEEQRAKFGFLLDALGMGAPPHGGIASGIDRMVMAAGSTSRISGTPMRSRRTRPAFDPMSGAPSDVPQEQLDELGIRLAPQKEKPS